MARAANSLHEAGANLPAIEKAIDEFLEEGYAYQVNRHEIEETPAELRAEALRNMLPERTQADGYFGWLRYLVWLDGVRELAADLQLSAAEVQGLGILHRCRNKFQRSHPPCMHCGMPNEDHEFRCHNCMGELKR
jgi:hypothetical protein